MTCSIDRGADGRIKLRIVYEEPPPPPTSACLICERATERWRLLPDAPICFICDRGLRHARSVPRVSRCDDVDRDWRIESAITLIYALANTLIHEATHG